MLPSKLVLELLAVHMPICFVIAWLFLDSSGVSRKPGSVDCVSLEGGAGLLPRAAEGMCEAGCERTTCRPLGQDSRAHGTHMAALPPGLFLPGPL